MHGITMSPQRAAVLLVLLLQLLLLTKSGTHGASVVVALLALLQPQPYLSAICRLLAAGSSTETVTASGLKRRMDTGPGTVYLGRGFEFTPKHAQVLRDRLDEGLTAAGRRGHGSSAIHALSFKNRGHLCMKLEDLRSHTLILGTTGAGKTRMFELLSTQAVLRGETVIVIDPKGDDALRLRLKQGCRLAGRSRELLELDLAHPERSVHWDPLGTYGSAAEVGARLSSLMSASGSAASFRAYAANAVTAAVIALKLRKKRVTLAAIRDTLARSAAFTEALQAFFEEFRQNRSREVQTYWSHLFSDKSRGPGITLMRNFYEWLKLKGHMEENSDLEILLAAAAMDRTYFEKTSAGIMPLLNSLSSGVLRSLFSSGRGISSKQVLNQHLIIYISLRTLIDAATGVALGRLLLADLASASGYRYADESGDRSCVSVFVDEASEVMGEALVQLLNKSRGAGFAITLATQTIADLASRSGSRDGAFQILGNTNNLIAMRLNDADTAKTVVSAMPLTRIRDHTGGSGYQETEGRVNQGTVARGYRQREVPLIPPEILPQLPDFEYFARLADGRVIKGRIPLMSSKGL